MQRTTISIALLLTLSLACSLGGLSAAPTLPPTTPSSQGEASPPPSQAGAGGESERRCGDNVCDGPENPQNCPQDCVESTLPAELPAPGKQTVSEHWVTNPTTGARLYVLVTSPEAETQILYPALVIVPGGIGYASNSSQSDNLSELLAAEGIVAVEFDPDGRGQSEGVEDYNGCAQQDGLAAVIEFTAALPQVDPARVGVASFSYGITMASGALARHPDLPVLFLMDWEGPADRFDTTVGCSENVRIDFAPCDDLEFWREREALKFIPDVQVPYQRLQSEKDHVQPDVDHAIAMINAAVQGDSPWVRLNDLSPNQTYDLDNPPPMITENDTRSLEQLTLQYAQEMFRLHSTP